MAGYFKLFVLPHKVESANPKCLKFFENPIAFAGLSSLSLSTFVIHLCFETINSSLSPDPSPGRSSRKTWPLDHSTDHSRHQAAVIKDALDLY